VTSTAGSSRYPPATCPQTQPQHRMQPFSGSRQARTASAPRFDRPTDSAGRTGLPPSEVSRSLTFESDTQPAHLAAFLHSTHQGGGRYRLSGHRTPRGYLAQVESALTTSYWAISLFEPYRD